jgi:hypothetical protein
MAGSSCRIGTHLGWALTIELEMLFAYSITLYQGNNMMRKYLMRLFKTQLPDEWPWKYLIMCVGLKPVC